MPAPIPYAHRQEMVRRKMAGESLRSIAQSLGYSYWGVRKIWRQYSKEGEAGLSGPGKRRKPAELYQQALQWKQEHPQWGAGLVRSLLLQRWPAAEVPSERTLQRWWQEAGLNRRRPRGVRSNPSRAREVHEVWQVDGVEEGDRSWVAGPCWPDAFSPYGQVSRIPPSEVQAFFRAVLARWGKPRRIRVDRGHPWGQVEGLPMPLVLWLVTWIPPRKPQYNGTVERAQGVLQQWAEPKHWPDEVEGQRRLDWAITMQREGYRGADGKTRAERFPQLAMNPRAYRPEREEAEWTDIWRPVLSCGGWARRGKSRSMGGHTRWAVGMPAKTWA